MSKKKICFVCQRYGLEVNGGAELQCRLFAEHLVPFYDVRVMTTCAIDYITWKNEYPEGEEMLNGVQVSRFRVERERDMAVFSQICLEALSGRPVSPETERAFFWEQGPVCRELVAYLWANYTQFQAVLFSTYLYYTCLLYTSLAISHARHVFCGYRSPGAAQSFHAQPHDAHHHRLPGYPLLRLSLIHI